MFHAVLTRLASMLHEYEWRTIAYKLVCLSPRSFVVAMAAGEFYLSDFTNRLQWMLRGPNPYILNRPTMMHEVCALDLYVAPPSHELQFFPSLHHFTSLRKLHWESQSLLPDDFFSLVRQHVTGLQDLELYIRRITAPLLNDIVQMTNLESLKLVAGSYNVIPPLGNLQGLKDLTILDWGHYERNDDLVLPSTLEGLTRIETLDLGAKFSEPLAKVMPAMFPLLEELSVYRQLLSQDALATLESHYKDKEGFMLTIW